MRAESPWLIGRQEIADYAGGICPNGVTAMIKAGLKCYGGKKKGSTLRSKAEWVDDFFKEHPDFIPSRYLKKASAITNNN